MARFASTPPASSRLLPPIVGPGSNGYLRRQLWLVAGAYSFTVKKTGKLKVVALGAGGAAGYNRGGTGGGLSIGEYAVVAGQVVTVTVGAGGAGGGYESSGAAGGTTTVVCSAASINMTANGGATAGGATTAGGAASGGNISNFTGGASANFTLTGGASSATPWGHGVPTQNNHSGGQGWGSANTTGATHTRLGGGGSYGPALNRHGGPGRTSGGGISATATAPNAQVHGESAPWWDLTDIDGGGGGTYFDGSDYAGGAGGNGAGGGAGTGGYSGGHGGFGGGGGGAGSGGPGNGGNGGGGGAGSTYGGRGGDGAVIIWWDEVDA